MKRNRRWSVSPQVMCHVWMETDCGSPQETKNQFSETDSVYWPTLRRFTTQTATEQELSAFIGLISLLKQRQVEPDCQQLALRASTESRVCLQPPIYISQPPQTKSQVTEWAAVHLSAAFPPARVVFACWAAGGYQKEGFILFLLPNMPEELMAPLAAINEGIFSLVNKIELFNIISIPQRA